MKLKIIFKNFKEPETLNFRPTFKYDINSNNWDSRSCQMIFLTSLFLFHQSLLMKQFI